MIKKQTIWLLTMISLLVVLSVYYVMSDKENFAFTFVADQTVNDNSEENISMDIKDEDGMHGSDLFLTTRMEMEDKRSMKKERLQEVIKANNVSVTEVNDALEEIDFLENISLKEEIAQESILSLDKAYEDVLVRTEEDKVQVHLITDDLQAEAAGHIIQVVRDEIGVNEVEVNYQSAIEK